MNVDGETVMRNIYWLSIILAIVGSINWGLFGLTGINLVNLVFGQNSQLITLSYSIIGFAGLYLALHTCGNLLKK